MSVNIVSTDSAQDVTKAIGMFNKTVETETSAPEATVETNATAQATGETTNEVTEPSSVETDAAEETQAADADATQGAETQAADKSAGKEKKGGFQRRIDKLTKARSAAEQERDYWRDLAVKGQKPEAGQVSAQQQVAIDAADPEPQPDTFNDVGSYMKALTRWEIKQEQKKSELVAKTNQAKESFHSKIQDFHKKVGEFKKATADFDDVAAEFDETYPSGMPNTMLDIIAESEAGPQIMYDIAKDHTEFDRLAKLSPIALAREIGKREAKISVNSGANQTQTNKTTNAPAPISPVRGTAAVSKKDPSNMSMADYNAWRNAGGGR